MDKIERTEICQNKLCCYIVKVGHIAAGLIILAQVGWLVFAGERVKESL